MIEKSDKWRQLSPRARSVFSTLWSFAGKADPSSAGGFLLTCFPKRALLAKREGCTEATIDRALRELRAAGLVVSLNNPKRTGKNNIYTLFVPAELVAENLREHEQETGQTVPGSTGETCGVQRIDDAGINNAKVMRSSEPVQGTCSGNTYNEPTPKPPDRNAAGGGVVSSAAERAKAIEALKAAGVGGWKSLGRQLESGTLKAADVWTVLRHADEQENEIGPGLLVEWLKPEWATDRAEWMQEQQAADRHAADLKRYTDQMHEQAEAERQHQEVIQEMQRRAVIFIDEALSQDDSAAVQLVRAELGRDGSAIAAKMGPESLEWVQRNSAAKVLRELAKLAGDKRDKRQREDEEREQRLRDKEAKAAASIHERRAVELEREAIRHTKDIDILNAVDDAVLVEEWRRRVGGWNETAVELRRMAKNAPNTAREMVVLVQLFEARNKNSKGVAV